MNDNIDLIIEELSEVFYNLKAEVIVSEILKNSNVDRSKIVVNNQSTFKRPHRKDVLNVEHIDNEKIRLNLSRNGLYDNLPEGLFHKSPKSTKKVSYTNLRKSFKDEENEARRFFSPLENEFFYQKLNINNKERDFLSRFLSLEDTFLFDFWKINPSVPKKYINRLLKIIPFSSKIAGNLELSRICLEKIIKRKIEIKKNESGKQKLSNQLVNNERILGTNFTLSGPCNITKFPSLSIEIILENKDVFNDIFKRNILHVFNLFYDFFMPVEYEIITNFTLKNKCEFSLHLDQEPILGLTTQL